MVQEGQDFETREELVSLVESCENLIYQLVARKQKIPKVVLLNCLSISHRVTYYPCMCFIYSKVYF